MSLPAMALAIAIVAFYGGWTVNGWQNAYKEQERAHEILVNVQQSAAAAIRKADNVIEAQNNATARSVRLRSDLDASRNELDRLRDTLRNLPRAEVAGCSCPDTTTAIGNILDSCAAELVELAGRADRHAGDAKTLTDAWPK